MQLFMKWKLLFWFLDFLSSRVFLAVFWSQRQQARDEIAVVSVLKDWFFVTAACGENAHLCQIQINKCIITVAAGIQMRLCSVSVVWKQKNPLEFFRCCRVAVRKMFHGRSLFRKGAMPHWSCGARPAVKAGYIPWHLEAPLATSLWP